MQRYYLNVPYPEKDVAKSLGAKWDAIVKRWYYTSKMDETKFWKWIVRPFMKVEELSEEQQELIRRAKRGENVLVDACIGSGKTTTIQVMCNELADRKILYLTYNKLLKLDAQTKICMRNVTVNNYHGFAYKMLRNSNIHCGVSDTIQTFNRVKPKLDRTFDMLVLDEYQDIEQEIAEMLEYIKAENPGIQIIAVGDMQQKIYDKTTLCVQKFIDSFLEEYSTLHFTKCFRLSGELAKKLGRIWGKRIDGVNRNCKVEFMDRWKVTKFLATQNPSDILCLGSRTGKMADVLNTLEKSYPEKFNKKTVYASIADNDGESAIPDSHTAIFTTFDSSKGLERPICVVFDYTESYWQVRIKQPLTDAKILRNIFCVAASRGKQRIIFVEDEFFLLEDTLREAESKNAKLEDYDISKMFDFKYKEDVEDCYSLLKTKRISRKREESIIDIQNTDGMIDLSPCIGTYQEAMFFHKYDIDKAIEHAEKIHRDRPKLNIPETATTEQKILYLTAYETYHDRYVKQVKIPFVPEDKKTLLRKRLSSVFSPDEIVQQRCEIPVEYGKKGFSISGVTDVCKDGKIFELKFVSELKHEHFLQLACYLVACRVKKGILWNVRNNEKYEVTIPDRKKFMEAVVKTITKGTATGFEIDNIFYSVPSLPRKRQNRRKQPVEVC